MRVERVSVDHRRHRICRIVKTVDELKAQCHEEGDAQKDKWVDGRRMDCRKVRNQVSSRIDETDGENYQENCGSNRAW